jgi:hypothetical protein
MAMPDSNSFGPGRFHGEGATLEIHPRVWQAPGAAQTTNTAVVINSKPSGRGLGPTPFTFTFSDTQGFADLGVVNTLIDDSIDGHHACYLGYSRRINTLYLVNDNGDGLLPGQSLASGGSTANVSATSVGSQTRCPTPGTISV